MKRAISLFLALCVCITANIAYAAEAGDEFVSVANEDFTKGTGTWGPSSNASGMHYDDGDRNPHVGWCVFDTGGTATIKYSLPSAGSYELLWFFSGWPSDGGTVTLSFDTAEGRDTTPGFVNSSKSAGFASIGTYVMDAGDGEIDFSSNGQARFSALKWVYKGSVLLISSKKYSIDKINNIISDIPIGETAEAFLDNMSYPQDMTAKVTDVDLKEKAADEEIEDGDRFIIGESEFFLKTYADGIIYSDNFNYRDKEEYERINDSLNISENANKFMRGKKAEISFEKYEGNRAMHMTPSGTGDATYEMNFIGFSKQTKKTVIEYDVAEKNLDKAKIWAYVSALYTNAAASSDAGFALWGSNLNSRGTLMRDSENKARWISSDGKSPLIMTDAHGAYHVVQVIDFSGDIETYIDGQKARIANEQISSDVSKSMQGAGGIKAIGLGAYLESGADYGQYTDGAIVWDNVKVYDPSDYAGYFIDMLPETSSQGSADILPLIANARKVVDELNAIGIEDNEIDNISKLTYWEDQIGNVGIRSDVYNIDEKNRIISGVVDGQSSDDFISNLIIPENVDYDLTTKENGVIASGDKLTVTDAFGEDVVFEITADKKALISGYQVEGNEVLSIPFGTKVSDFLKNVITARGITAKVYTGDKENTDTVTDKDTLKAGDEVYTLNVVAASGENALSSAVYTVDNTLGTISDILYDTGFQTLFNALTVPEYAVASYPYEDGYNGPVKNGDKITVTAQNGDKREYTLIVNSGNSSSELVASAQSGLVVNKENKTVANVKKGMAVADLLKALSATNNGKVKLFSQDQNEKISGTVSGNETVRVYPEDPKPGEEYDVYALSPDPEDIQVQNIIVTVEEPQFTTDTGTIATSSSSWTGYNKIVTRFVTNGLGIFNFTVPEAGRYNITVYLSCQSLTQAGRFAVVKNGTEIAGMSVNVQQQPEGWFDLGTFELDTGDEVQVTSSTTSGFVRLTAARMAMSKSVTLRAAYTGGEGDGALFEGQNTVDSEDITIMLLTEASLDKSNISFMSDNANAVDFDLSTENGMYNIKPKTKLGADNVYYLNIDSAGLSKPYSFIIKGRGADISASADTVFLTSDGKRAENAENAQKAAVGVKVRNNTPEQKKAKLIICYYPKGGTMDSMTEKNIDIPAGGEADISEEIPVNNKSSEGTVKVFLWTDDLVPITGVYCR